jgi:hypothetical protein
MIYQTWIEEFIKSLSLEKVLGFKLWTLSLKEVLGLPAGRQALSFRL